MEKFIWAGIILAWILLFFFSYVFVHYFLFKDYELRGKFVKLLFSITFSTSCTLLELFLLELSSYSISHVLWQINLLTFSVLMLYFIPFFLIFKLIEFKYVVWVFFVAGYYYLLEFNRSLIDHDENVFLHFSLVEQIRLLGINGVVLSAVLSGFGAINCTYNYFNFFNEDLLKEDINELVLLCKKNIEGLVESKLVKQALQKSKAQSWNPLKKIFGNMTEIKKYKDEIKSAEAINCQYLKHINDILKNKEKHNLRGTFKGKTYYMLGRILTIYSVYKIISSAINFAFKRRYSLDPISRGLQIICYFFDIPAEFAEFITTYAGFAFIGILIFTNIRGFLLLLINTINNLARLISTGISTQILMAVISEVTGAYFMATVLLMRANIPESKRANISTALSGVDFNTFHHIFDATFSISALITAILLLIKHKMHYKSKIS